MKGFKDAASPPVVPKHLQLLVCWVGPHLSSLPRQGRGGVKGLIYPTTVRE